MSDYELYHYGIPGMKWGIRRSQKKLARINKKSKRQNWSEDATTAATIKTKKVKQMSNAELKKINERIRLEKEYSNLTKSNPSAGRKFVNEVARELSKDAAKNAIKKGSKKGFEWTMRKLKEE